MDKSGNFGQNEIISKIQSFNSTNTGGLYIAPPMFGNFSKGTLDIKIQFNGNTYPVQYKKLDEK